MLPAQMQTTITMVAGMMMKSGLLAAHAAAAASPAAAARGGAARPRACRRGEGAGQGAQGQGDYPLQQ
jgi:hypothetical protein